MAKAASEAWASGSPLALSSQQLLEQNDFPILGRKFLLPVILPSLEIMFMIHLGKRISPQFIIDKVYIFNNRI